MHFGLTKWWCFSNRLRCIASLYFLNWFFFFFALCLYGLNLHFLLRYVMSNNWIRIGYIDILESLGITYLMNWCKYLQYQTCIWYCAGFFSSYCIHTNTLSFLPFDQLYKHFYLVMISILMWFSPVQFGVVCSCLRCFHLTRKEANELIKLVRSRIVDTSGTSGKPLFKISDSDN